MTPEVRDRTLFLVDISSFIFRAFFAIRALSNSKGEPTNAVYGVLTMLVRLMEEAKPRHLLIAYDSKEPSFRKIKYAEYKANRSAPPEDLIPQFDRIEEVVQALKIPSLRSSGVEADDLIATATAKWLELDPIHDVVIVTGDKDLMQLVGERVRVWDTMNQKVYHREQVEAKFGLPPEQIRDYLALVGDSSDNIPGVPGIGPKTAVELLKTYGTVAQVLKAAEAGQISGKKGQVIAQSREVAELSQDLTTLKSDCPLPSGWEKTEYEFQISSELMGLLQELGFHSLLKKWQSSHQQSVSSLSSVSSELGGEASRHASVQASGQVQSSSPRWVTVRTSGAFMDLLSQLTQQGEFAFDLETTSLNPRLAEIVGFSFAFDDQCGYYIPVGHRLQEGETQLDRNWVIEQLRPILENPKIKKIGQNVKYDWSVLHAYRHAYRDTEWHAKGIALEGVGGDTMIAGYLLDPGARTNLAALALRELNYSMLSYEEVCGKGASQITFDQVPIDLATRYSAEDAWVAWVLWKRLSPRLLEQGLMEVFATIELPMIGVLMRMEAEGICLDVAWMQELSQKLGVELDQIEARIRSFLPAERAGDLNLNSPKQLSQFLFEDLRLPVQSKTKTGYSTDADVLEALTPLHEVPRLLLEYREITKLKSTYVDPLPRQLDPVSHKIHTSFHQTVAATGRLSSSDPNLQNIPVRTERGLLIRRGFVASPGNVLVSADYSQIELRILAHMSQDPDLVASFQRGEDVHRRTASEIFEVDPNQVTDEQRGIAKAINFGLMYGKTAFGLSQELKISRKEAAETIERYFQRYKKVKEFLNHLIESAREKGYAMTLLGRKRPLPEIHSKNHPIRTNAERMAMNAPIQGTAADLMKLAMIRIDEGLIAWKRERGFRSALILQVHDEVLLDCPAAEVDLVRTQVVQWMENAMKLSVPLTVNSSQGKNWMKL